MGLPMFVTKLTLGGQCYSPYVSRDTPLILPHCLARFLNGCRRPERACICPQIWKWGFRTSVVGRGPKEPVVLPRYAGPLVKGSGLVGDHGCELWLPK